MAHIREQISFRDRYGKTKDGIKNAKDPNTIKAEMYRWMGYILMTAIIMNLLTVLVHFWNISRCEMVMEQEMELNQFYEELENENRKLISYAQTGTAQEYTDLSEKRKNANLLLEKLETETVSKGFSRDMTDVGRLFASYQDKIEEIHRILQQKYEADFNSDMLMEILDEYENSQEIYNLIRNEFESLHSSLLEYIKIQRQTVRWQAQVYYIEFVAVLICLISAGIWKGRKLAGNIVKPLQILTAHAIEIRDGHVADCRVLSEEISANTETDILIYVFNMMLERIKEQFSLAEENAKFRTELYQKELEQMRIVGQLRESEMKALQMQMNPHFLFNTLNMISQTVYLEDPEKTIFLLQKTAALLRYSLDYMGKSVTLEHEIEMLDCYVCLQEQRFGERIMFNFDFDESFHQMKVPCLILQPLVENSIVHGLGMCMEKGEVTVKTRHCVPSGQVWISVIDNGTGIEEKKMEELRKMLGEPSADTGMIGLKNVSQRLNRFYRGKAEIQLFSIPNEYTEVRLILPTEIPDVG